MNVSVFFPNQKGSWRRFRKKKKAKLARRNGRIVDLKKIERKLKIILDK